MCKNVFTITIIISCAISLSGKIFALPNSAPLIDNSGSFVVKSPELTEPSYLDDTLYSFPGFGTWPSGIAWDGEDFWLGDLDSNMICRVDTTGTILQRVRLLTIEPAGIEFDGQHLWFVYEHNAMLYKLEHPSGAIIDSFYLPDSGYSDPQSWGLAWDGTYLWHSRYKGHYTEPGRIFQLDPNTGQVLYSFPSPTDYMLGIAWDDPYLCGVDIITRKLYWMNPWDSTVVKDTNWMVRYPLGIDWGREGYLWGVSGASRSSHQGTERVYRSDIMTVIGITENEEKVLDQHLIGPHPNPCSHSTEIVLTLPKPTTVKADVYTVLGQWFASIQNQHLSAGKHRLQWGIGKAKAGVYLLRVTAGELTFTHRLVVAR